MFLATHDFSFYSTIAAEALARFGGHYIARGAAMMFQASQEAQQFLEGARSAATAVEEPLVNTASAEKIP